jgi:hypothetical protein
MPAAARTQKPPPQPSLPTLDFDDDLTHWHRCPNRSCGNVWAHTDDPTVRHSARIQTHLCPVCSSWTGEQIDVTITECELFIAKKQYTIIGTLRLTSPQNGF